jgi:NDP-sugar pyrophosphorylase family protein
MSYQPPGRLVEWLYKKEPVYGYMLKDYLWDIGTHEAYKKCNQRFSKLLIIKKKTKKEENKK